jgi:4-amino-4-deoxy-L-arabinose transferase-like glycosyltransferase
MGRRELALLVMLTIGAALLRGYSLRFFDVISVDGTSYAEAARGLAAGNLDGIGVYGLYPVLIWLAGLLVPDRELAGRLVSLVFGSLAIVPCYLLGRELFSRRVALAASLIVVVWPSMVSTSCEVMTQAVHTTLQLSGVYLFWRMLRVNTPRAGILAGAALGLAMLTRQEALLLFVVLPTVLCWYNLRDLRERLPALAAYGGSFGLLLMVQLLLVHHVTGEWQLSAKADSALNDALSYFLNSPDLIHRAGYEPKGYLDILREYPTFVIVNSLSNIKELWGRVIPPWCWPLVAAGIVQGGFGRPAWSRRWLLLAACTPVAVLIVFYYISSGYLEAYLPVLFIWGVVGWYRCADFVAKRLGALDPIAKLSSAWRWLVRLPYDLAAVLCFVLVLLAPQFRSVVPDADYRVEMDDGRRAEKFRGIMIRDYLPPGKLLTRWARLSFYAEREWVMIPEGMDLAQVLDHGRKNGARYLVIDTMLYGVRPLLDRELFDPLRDRQLNRGIHFNTDPSSKVKGLHPYLMYLDPQGLSVIIYEIPPA